MHVLSSVGCVYNLECQSHVSEAFATEIHVHMTCKCYHTAKYESCLLEGSVNLRVLRLVFLRPGLSDSLELAQPPKIRLRTTVIQMPSETMFVRRSVNGRCSPSSSVNCWFTRQISDLVGLSIYYQ